jgi:hypothetical protein
MPHFSLGRLILENRGRQHFCAPLSLPKQSILRPRRSDRGRSWRAPVGIDRVAATAAGAQSLRGCARHVRSSRRRIPWRSSCRGIHSRLPLPLLRRWCRPKHLRRPGRIGCGAAAGAGQRCRSCRGELPSSRREPSPPLLRRHQLWSRRSCVSCGAGPQSGARTSLDTPMTRASATRLKRAPRDSATRATRPLPWAGWWPVTSRLALRSVLQVCDGGSESRRWPGG